MADMILLYDYAPDDMLMHTRGVAISRYEWLCRQHKQLREHGRQAYIAHDTGLKQSALYVNDVSWSHAQLADPAGAERA